MEDEQHYQEQFKLKRLIKKLNSAEGDGTSLITLIIPANKKLAEFNQMLTEEQSKAENIKDRVNRQSVIEALVSTKEVLRNIKGDLPNGLCLFVGKVKVPGQNNLTRKVKIVYEPFKEIKNKIYFCGDLFQTEVLEKLLESHDSFGFAIIDGNGCLMARLQGNNKTIISRYTVDLPKKHHKGGQSSNRFANIRAEKRLIYTKRVAEEMKKAFIGSNSLPNVQGIIMAGNADFKTSVFDNNTFDERLKKIVIKLIDVSYGFEMGLNQAIDQSRDLFKEVRLVQEQEKLKGFMENINNDTGLVCYGVNNTMKCLEKQSIDTMILFEELEIQMVTLQKPNAQEDDPEAIIKRYIPIKDLLYKTNYFDSKTKKTYNILEYDPLIDYLQDNQKDLKINIFYITDLSPEGHQFVTGFQGMGAFLKFKQVQEEYESEESDYDLSEFI